MDSLTLSATSWHSHHAYRCFGFPSYNWLDVWYEGWSGGGFGFGLFGFSLKQQRVNGRSTVRRINSKSCLGPTGGATGATGFGGLSGTGGLSLISGFSATSAFSFGGALVRGSGFGGRFKVATCNSNEVRLVVAENNMGVAHLMVLHSRQSTAG